MKRQNVLITAMLAVMVGCGIFVSCLSTSEQALALRGGLAAVNVGADVVKSTRETKARAEAEAAAKAEEEQRIAEQKAKQKAQAEAEQKAKQEAEAREEARKLAREEEKRKLAEAAEPEYRELFNKAKEYEEKGQIFYALAFYVDALMVPNAANEEAKERFTSIGKLLLWDGLPGVKSKDQFALYNAWVSLLEDAEKYWTEYPPFYFDGTLQQGDLNYENQTASYNLYVDVKYNTKYLLLMEDILLPALQKAWRNDWKKIPEDWPLLSVHNEGNAGKHLVKEVALLEDESQFYNPWMLCYNTSTVFSVTSMDQNFRPTSFSEANESNIINLRRAIGNQEDEEYSEYSERAFAYTFYDVKCSITDNNGEKLLTSKRFLVAPYRYQNSYVFEGVSQSVMSSIESSGCNLIIDGLYLQYGKLNTKKLNRELIKDLKEISIPISNINQRYANSQDISKLYSLVRDSRSDGK